MSDNQPDESQPEVELTEEQLQEILNKDKFIDSTSDC